MQEIYLIIESAGDWWKNDIQTVMEDFLRRGGDPVKSYALTINSQHGDLYNNYSRQGTILGTRRGYNPETSRLLC